jgi:hypothetical protein
MLSSCRSETRASIAVFNVRVADAISRESVSARSGEGGTRASERRVVLEAGVDPFLIHVPEMLRELVNDRRIGTRASGRVSTLRQVTANDWPEVHGLRQRIEAGDAMERRQQSVPIGAL